MAIKMKKDRVARAIAAVAPDEEHETHASMISFVNPDIPLRYQRPRLYSSLLPSFNRSDNERPVIRASTAGQQGQEEATE